MSQNGYGTPFVICWLPFRIRAIPSAPLEVLRYRGVRDSHAPHTPMLKLRQPMQKGKRTGGGQRTNREGRGNLEPKWLRNPFRDFWVPLGVRAIPPDPLKLYDRIMRESNAQTAAHSRHAPPFGMRRPIQERKQIREEGRRHRQ